MSTGDSSTGGVAARTARRRAVPAAGCRLVLVLVVLWMAVGCSTSPPTTGGPATADTSSAQPTPSMTPPQDKCTAVRVPAKVQQRVLTAADGSLINTAWLGSGSVAAVLLHQTDTNGLCGMLFFADYLAQHGVRTVALDLCGYGQSFCQLPAQQDPVLPVKLVTDTLRTEGATRVVLVGASMGGTLAMHAADDVAADAVIDLSGPAVFNNLDLTNDAPTITMPILIAFGRNTDPQDLAAVQRRLPAMPTTKKELLRYPTGHGVDLLHEADTNKLTPLAAKVLARVRSD